MRKLKVFTSSLLLATIPSTLLYPQDALPRTAFQLHYEQKYTEHEYILSYDDILRLFDEIESGELENKCTPEELEKIKHFIAFLAKEGALPDNSEESLSLDEDIKDLLNGEDNLYRNAPSFVASGEYQYMILPAALNGRGEVILCKGWLEKRSEDVKKFAQKHKKALIIGAVVVVAAAVVVVALVSASSATAVAAAAGAAGAATTPDSDKKEQKEESSPSPSPSTDMTLGMAAPPEAPILKSTIDDQIFSFKENIMQNQFFHSTNPVNRQQELSWEENGRALGALFAHDSYNNLQHLILYHPWLAQEVHDINEKYTFSIPEGNNEAGHAEIDRKFSTDYTYLYSNPGQEVDFNTLSYQIRGERALAFGYYNQGIHDLGKAIETNPTNPVPYLERGIAYFGVGQYDRSLEDYQQFTSQAQKPNPLSVSEFSLGFTKGLPRGIYESGEGLFLFITDFVTHPIQTCGQIVDSVTTLVNLVRNDEWGVIAEALSPELRQLVIEWDTLPSDIRGELAGYSIGKHGTDILIPGALAKVAIKSVKSAQELAAVCRNLQIAQETLVLETAAGIGNSAKIAEVVGAGQRTARIAEDLGFSAPEMGKLKQAGQLETAIANTLDYIAQNPAMRESFDLFERAQNFLKSYKDFMPESYVRELIHQTGIKTFIRPKGIPENYKVRLTDRGAGMEYVHPTNTHLRVRVMPGKPHSPFPYQQKPYIIQMKDGQALDKFGNKVNKKAPEAHIPCDEFVYRD